MIRLVLLAVLILFVGGLAYLGLKSPTYTPHHIEQPVALPPQPTGGFGTR